MKVVPITPDMRLIAALLGGMRAMVNRRQGVADKKIGPQDGLQADQDAIIGELAFAQLHNVWPDLSLTPRSGSCDVVVGRMRCDVKTTRRKDGSLLATTKGNPDVDAYVLAILDDEQVLFPGYALASELCHESRLTTKGHGPTYAMNQAELRAWKADHKSKTPDSGELSRASINH